MVPGCGNSDLSQKICALLGITDIEVDSFDYEEQIVAKMEAEKPPNLKLTYRFGDCTNLSEVYQDE